MATRKAKAANGESDAGLGKRKIDESDSVDGALASKRSRVDGSQSSAMSNDGDGSTKAAAREEGKSDRGKPVGKPQRLQYRELKRVRVAELQGIVEALQFDVGIDHFGKTANVRIIRHDGVPSTMVRGGPNDSHFLSDSYAPVDGTPCFAC